MFAGKNVPSLRQRTEIIIFNKTLRELTIARISAALIREKEILGKRIGFIPSVGHALVRTRALFRAAQGLLWQVRQGRLGGAPVNIEGIGAFRELVCIDQATASLVVGVGGQVIIHIKLSRGL